MTPIVLIATHERVEITKQNIESLRLQSIKPDILLVTSNPKEFNFYKQYDDGSLFNLVAPNKPLGAKWQAGAEMVKTIQKGGPLIITGSDDILAPKFIENACRLVSNGVHFVGLRRWWQHHRGTAYYCQYMANLNQPIGGGRIFSPEMLTAIKYHLFDSTKSKHLDDYAWTNARKTDLKCIVLDDPEKEGLSIHAIKGNWPMLNPFTTHHRNVKLLKRMASIEALPSLFKKYKISLKESGNSFICVE